MNLKKVLVRCTCSLKITAGGFSVIHTENHHQEINAWHYGLREVGDSIKENTKIARIIFAIFGQKF